MGPLFPDGLDLASSLHWGTKLSGSATIAHNFLIIDTHRRVVVGPLALDGLWAAGGRETLVSRIGHSIDHIAGYGAMGGSLGGEKGDGGNSAGEQHLDSDLGNTVEHD